MTAPYTHGFYDTIRAGVQSSANVIVPLVIDHIAPRTVIDVGCGEGWWAHRFAQAGCEVIGVDGAHVPGSPLGDRFVTHDLRHRLPAYLHGRFDVAVCLEVAEHLPPGRADTFVADLCALAPVVVFSAAIPGQGGAGHVNEQWPGYWVKRFRSYGYAVSGALRFVVWDNPAVENWYAQNLMVYTSRPGRYPRLFTGPLCDPYPLVHPVLYRARTGAR